MVSMSTPSVVGGAVARSAEPLLFCHCHIEGAAAAGRAYPVPGDLAGDIPE